MLAFRGKSANSARVRASNSADLARPRANPGRLRFSAAHKARRPLPAHVFARDTAVRPQARLGAS
jgi:hypothetical protein